MTPVWLTLFSLNGSGLLHSAARPWVLANMGCCDGFVSRLCAALPIAIVFMLAAISQLPSEGGSRVVLSYQGSHLEMTDVEARFGPRVSPGGVSGVLRLAVPVEGCEPLKNQGDGPWVALMQRGGEGGPTECGFVTKVLNAQHSGAIAAVVFDNVASGALIPMAGGAGDETSSVKIPSVFVSRESGVLLASSVERNAKTGETVTITLTSDEDTTDKASFVSTAFVACVMTVFVLSSARCTRRWNGRLNGELTQIQNSLPTGERVATVQEVDLKSKSRVHCDTTYRPDNQNGTNDVCTVCLDEYEDGDTIRELECEHAFHKECIDEWLTTKRACCPMCKHSLVPIEEVAVEVETVPEVAPVVAPVVSPNRRRHRRGRRQRHRSRVSQGGDGEINETGDSGDVEAGVRDGDDVEALDGGDTDSTTAPLLAFREGRRETRRGMFRWFFARADDADDSIPNDGLSPVSETDETDSPYVAPQVVDVEIGEA